MADISSSELQTAIDKIRGKLKELGGIYPAGIEVAINTALEVAFKAPNVTPPTIGQETPIDTSKLSPVRSGRLLNTLKPLLYRLEQASISPPTRKPAAAAGGAVAAKQGQSAQAKPAVPVQGAGAVLAVSSSDEELIRLEQARLEQARLEQHQANQLKRVLLELKDTEQTYLAQLKVICTWLFATQKMNPELDILRNLVTGSLPSLLAFSEKMLQEMNEIIEKIGVGPQAALSIGILFTRNAPFFKMYIAYVNIFDEITKEVGRLEAEQKNLKEKFLRGDEKRELSKNEKDRLYMDMSNIPEAKGLSVLSLLIPVIQRPPRYKLLFTEIAKYLDEDKDKEAKLDPHTNVVAALNIISEANNSINEKKRNQESAAILAILSNNKTLDITREYTTDDIRKLIIKVLQSNTMEIASEKAIEQEISTSTRQKIRKENIKIFTKSAGTQAGIDSLSCPVEADTAENLVKKIGMAINLGFIPKYSASVQDRLIMAMSPNKKNEIGQLIANEKYDPTIKSRLESIIIKIENLDIAIEQYNALKMLGITKINISIKDKTIKQKLATYIASQQSAEVAGPSDEPRHYRTHSADSNGSNATPDDDHLAMMRTSSLALASRMDSAASSSLAARAEALSISGVGTNAVEFHSGDAPAVAVGAHFPPIGTQAPQLPAYPPPAQAAAPQPLPPLPPLASRIAFINALALDPEKPLVSPTGELLEVNLPPIPPAQDAAADKKQAQILKAGLEFFCQHLPAEDATNQLFIKSILELKSKIDEKCNSAVTYSQAKCEAAFDAVIAGLKGKVVQDDDFARALNSRIDQACRATGKKFGM